MDEPIRFFLPGPTYVRRAIREALTAEIAGHRSQTFSELYREVAASLPPIFRTEGDVYVATSSSTLAMQAAVQSTVRERVLHLICGAFSERWMEISRSLGRVADRVEVPWGEAIDPDLVRQALRRRRYDAVAFAHNETSTGVLNPAEEIAAVVRQESDALVLVDSVSSLAGARLEVDDWGLDIALTGSQKALALPPGLAFFSLSERAAARAEAVEDRGFYTDVLRYRAKHRAGGTITTPATSIFHAARLQLRRIGAEGVEERWERHTECRAATEAWAEARGFTYLPATHRSPTVSCLRPPPGVDARALVERLATRGYTLGGGYGKLKAETVRIGHMGEVRRSDLDALFRVIDAVLDEERTEVATHG